MVTEKELQSKEFTFSMEGGASFQVTSKEMSRFKDKNLELANLFYDKINKYTEKHHIRPKYEGIEEVCQVSADSLKKCSLGKQKITRNILYKFVVGLKMDLEEANTLFVLCGGNLTEDDIGDYICIRALEDKDDVEFFIDQFNEYTQKYDKFQKTDKLKKLYV